MSLNEIINVTISRQTTVASRAGFGTMLIAGPSVVFPERTRAYSDAADMLTDGFKATDPEYIAAVSAFSQKRRPVSVKIGRRQVDVVGLSIDNVVDSTDYTATVNGTNYTFNSGVAATALTIATGLAAAIDAAPGVTAAADGDGTLTITNSVAGTALTVLAVGSNLSVEKPLSAANTVTDDLNNIAQVDDDWFALVLTSRTQADVELAAAWIATRDKLFGTASADTSILNSAVTTDIASVVKTLNYENTFVMYSAQAATKYPEAALFGDRLPTDPGSSTWAFKTLVGIAADSLTTAQSANARGKNANTYETIAGVSILRYGTVGSGEYIDVMRGTYWMKARIAERVFTRLVQLEKIPFTDAGAAIVEAEVKAQVSDGVASSFLASDPAPVVSVPLVATVSAANKAGRLLPDVKFTGTLAGAIHGAVINGTLSL